MPNPIDAEVFTQRMDPRDIVDFQSTISQGDADEDLLRPDEAVASFTLTATAEAVAAGLLVLDTGGRSPTLVGNLLRLWLAVDDAQQSASLFDGAGVELATELTFFTNSIPSRRRQRSMIVKVAQR